MASGTAVGVAKCGQARFRGSSLTSTRRTMPKAHRSEVDLAPLPDGSTAGALIPELTRYGPHQLIELEVARSPTFWVPTTMSAAISGSATATATYPAVCPPR